MKGMAALAFAAAIATMAAGVGAARPAEQPPSLADSFAIGSGGGVLCRAQSGGGDPVAKGMFDRGYAIVCRDAAAPVGRLYALRASGDEPIARIAAGRDPGIACEPFGEEAVEGFGRVHAARCRTRQDVGYRVYAVRRGRTLYAAEGLAGYDDALRLGLRSLVADRIVPGDVRAATTSIANPGAFARIQAGSLTPEQVLAEGYRRNNSGSYADAAEFFDVAGDRRADPAMRALLGEYVANRALQRSNLGEFDQADALFAELDRLPTRNPVQLRLRRNYRALHLVNEGRYADAAAVLARPIAPVDTQTATPEGAPVIDALTAAQVNADPVAGFSGLDAAALTPAERAGILDAQAEQVRGTIARLRGDIPAAQASLDGALARLLRVREGRVTATSRLRAQILGELSAVAEARGDQALAERDLRDALAMTRAQYPGSVASQAAEARLAGYLARRGRADQALVLYRAVVGEIVASGSSAVGIERLLGPYFALLAERSAAEPALAADFFLAAQTLTRPGVADTQAVLARELSGGSDEAARLFRQSVALGRDVERARIEIARLAAVPTPTAEDQARLDAARTTLARLEGDQVSTQASLSGFPRYRAVQGGAVSLADLQATLRPDEAYLKLTRIGDAMYGLFATRTDAVAYRLDENAAALGDTVDAIRASIEVEVNGQTQTLPFDIERARALYVTLMGPAAARMAATRHLVFEPDGAMLRLPVTLLVSDDRSVADYKARTAAKDADPFDFRGVAWLGRAADVSTAVSAAAFRDLRGARPSAAKFGYLGLGDNAPVVDRAAVARTRAVSAAGAIDCDWPLAAWSNPIQPAELYAARKAVGGTGDAVVTGKDFSDTAIIARKDLADYRIVHFATHGLVTAPRPECPARPALLTSFGPRLPDGKASDGLLTFGEVFDLRLDADLVILSACDTAGQASVAATREAGETSGGGTSLDGLVRAFVGAGGRSVLASHWPVPNDYRATERLIGGLFAAPRGTATAEALRRSELGLMDDKDTSHPYYWSAFALVGDGARPLVRPL